MGNRRIGQNAVAKIEDERSVSERLEDRVDAAVERGTSGAQRQRIEIALNRPSLLDVAGKTGIDHPVETYRVDRNALHVASEIAVRTTRKADDLRSWHSLPDF